MAGKELVTVKKPKGRPKLYREEYAEQAYRLALLGLTNEEMAGFFKVSIATFENWIANYPDFIGALKGGREDSDGKVAVSLFKRATGYSHQDIKVLVVNGEIVRVPIEVKYPPETAACIFWLKNRQRGRWRDKWAEDDNSNGNTIVIRDETAAGVKASDEVKIS